MKHLNRFLILMANLKCDKCNNEAEVQEPIGHLCYPCWVYLYAQLSRKETRHYGNGFSNSSNSTFSINRALS